MRPSSKQCRSYMPHQNIFIPLLVTMGWLFLSALSSTGCGGTSGNTGVGDSGSAQDTVPTDQSSQLADSSPDGEQDAVSPADLDEPDEANHQNQDTAIDTPGGGQDECLQQLFAGESTPCNDCLCLTCR